jgi:hypothetical protein
LLIIILMLLLIILCGWLDARLKWGGVKAQLD